MFINVNKYKGDQNWDNKIWFTSDLHINHNNICYPTSNWDNKEESCRKFNSIKHMNDIIFNNINKYVEVEDELYILGDLLFRWKTTEDYINFFDKINCQNIHLIYGNHDNADQLLQLNDIGGKSVYPKLKSQSYYKEIQIDGILCCLMHFPIHEWNNRHKKSYMIHGHSHSKWNYNQPQGRLDAGIDSAFKIFGEYRPFNWGEIKKLLK